MQSQIALGEFEASHFPNTLRQSLENCLAPGLPVNLGLVFITLEPKSPPLPQPAPCLFFVLLCSSLALIITNNTVYLLILLIAYHSPLECKLSEGRNLVLSTATFPHSEGSMNICSRNESLCMNGLLGISSG